MANRTATRIVGLLILMTFVAFVVSACNLSGAPSEEQIAQTDTAQVTPPPTRTPASTSGIPTTVPVTQLPNVPTFTFPTSVIVVPTSRPPVFFPSSTPLPVSIVILSPVSGNVVAGNVQILGSAIHPQFLQYQVEFGPDPNPGNLWFPATSAVTSPVLNGLLGIWNTTTVQDSKYQLRLRVYLRDGTLLTTVIGNITVQNRVNTPVPSATPNIPRPIAAFTQDKGSGDVPLTVRFTNQSTGTINTVAWNFGDGNSSSEASPTHTFGSPGLYNVTLTVNGPGGSSNVSRQINVTSPTSPVAGFTQDRTAGVAPLTVQFTDQSTGNITTYLWNFSDGAASTDKNPVHTFTTPGTYNVFLTVAGPGGTSSVTRQITVNSAVPPTATPTATFTPSFTPSPTNTATATTTVIPPTSTFTPTATFTDTATPTQTFTATATAIPAPQAFFASNGVPNDPLSIQFTNQSSGQLTGFSWNFGDGLSSTEQNPLHTYATGGSYQVTLTVTDTQNRTSNYTASVNVTEALAAAFSSQVNDLTVQFVSESSGPVSAYLWDFGDGNSSSDPNPEYTYASSGTYNVSLTVGAADGRTNTMNHDVTVIAPLIAGFTAAPNGLDVAFTNASTGDVASVTWNFGDGQTSNEASPTHTYATSGSYTVTLTVNSADGRSDQTSQDVTVAAPLHADFTAAPSGLDVAFTNASTGDVASVTWNFGDGQTSNEVNPTHSYAAGGTYTVTLAIGSADGRSDTISYDVTVSAPVHAEFSAAPSGLQVAFTNTSSGDITSLSWSFGDGQTSNEVSPTYTYTAGGTYTVTLTVNGADGSSDQTSQDVTVSVPVHAEFSAAPNGLQVAFTNTSTGDITSLSWSFGDGQTSNEVSPTYTYTAGGTYTVTLTVNGADGSSDQTSQDVTVSAPVHAEFSAAPSGLQVAFTNTSSGNITSMTWSFGDGQTSNEVSPTYTYAAGGTYTVTLTVNGADGSSDQISQDVTVSAPVHAGFSAAPSGLQVAFTNTSSGNITSLTWNFGDGQTSNEVSPTYTYGTDGTYTVTLTVNGADGSSDQTSQDVTVATPALADFTAQVNGLDVVFSNMSSGGIASLSWDFGDGQTSVDINPTHTYASPGTYSVTLTVVGVDGGSNSNSHDVTVNEPLHADFIDSVNGSDVQFNDQSTGNIVGYQWDFGDGQTSTDQNPTHTYGGGGTFTVNLTIFGADGSTDNHALDVTVAAPASAQFSAQVNGLDVQFSDQSTGNIIGYQWDFGDGQTSTDQNPLHTYGGDGTYTVTLTVTDGNGRGASTSQDVTVTAPQPTQAPPSLVDTTPILPDINALAGNLSAIYQNGVNTGKQATVFAKAGDSIFTQPNILSPFATAGQYALNGNEDLQSVIDWFNSTDLGGTTSFSRLGVAVTAGWHAPALVNTSRSDPSLCTPDETPLACELRLSQPAIMLVAVGQTDAQSNTDMGQFQNALTQIINTIVSNGTIPVLMTIPDDGSIPGLAAYNDAIITVANQNSVPVFNAARALNELPSAALSASPTGAGDLSADAVNNYGVNALNLDLLRLLDSMRNIIGINP